MYNFILSSEWQNCHTVLLVSLFVVYSYWHRPHTMQSGVYVTIACPSVCLSVPSIDRSSRARRVCTERPAGRRYRSIGGAGTQQQRCRNTAHSSKREQCHVYSRCRGRTQTCSKDFIENYRITQKDAKIVKIRRYWKWTVNYVTHCKVHVFHSCFLFAIVIC